MNLGAFDALVIFALAAAPGAIVSEIVTFGRPPMSERRRVRSLAFYLLMSAAAWIVAVGVLQVAIGMFSVADDLAVLVDASPGEGIDQVSAAGRLFGALLVAAVVAGVVLRIVTSFLLGAAHSLYEAVLRRDDHPALRPLRHALATVVSSPFAWDSLLARVRASGEAQLVRVRLRNGSDVYGVLAARGRADWMEAGRGILLDTEFVEAGGELLALGDNNGTYVHPDAIATVSFATFSESATEADKDQRPSQE